ncbi:MAG: hypothetical protein JXR84_21290, partial [Anaerolineae bacterium]|nr:hypothetical protein [Anaerolineae bacterium]
QCQLLGLSRATYYYTPAQESAENLALMRLIDAQYLKTPLRRVRGNCELPERVPGWFKLD